MKNADAHEARPAVSWHLPHRWPIAAVVAVQGLTAVYLGWCKLLANRELAGGGKYAAPFQQVMYTIDLAEELKGKGVTVNALHPATLMPTGMVAKAGSPPRSTIDEGAKAVLQLVLAPNLSTGQFFIGLTPGQAHQQAYDAEARAKLKSVSEQLTGLR